MEVKNLLHTEQVKGSKRSLFLDLKKTVNGQNYLVITQANQVDEGNNEETRIFVFENEIAKFSEAMMRSLLRFSMISDQKIKKYKEAVIEQYPKAYSKWSDGDEKLLRELYTQGLDIDHLSERLERNSNGILARLKKLGLAVEEEVQAVS